MNGERYTTLTGGINRRNKHFFRQKIERICCQSSCLVRNIKSFLERKKMIKVRNSDLNEERKIIREEISEGKMKTISPPILQRDNSLFKIIATM